MSLKEYEQRRRFGATPEPRPGERHGKPSGKGNRFVIQKHDATHIHYDLRLEMEGVLKSWACPKCVATPHVRKKLAVHVEDHPLDYIDFEGEIPEGEYGAGRVRIWDHGTYETFGDPAEALEKGVLTIILFGEKVRGEFTLVHMKNRGEAWLITLNRMDLLDPDLRELGRAAKMPSRVKPMQAVLVDAPFDSSQYIFEIKFDGIRALSYVNTAGELSIRSRNQHEQAFRYPELANLPKLLLAEEVVLDGEIVVLDEEGISRFQLLQGRMGLSDPVAIKSASNTLPVNYFVFDVLYYNGRDLTGLPLAERKQVLERIAIPHKYMRLTESIDTSGEAFFGAARQMGLEGVMAKRKESRYLHRRVRDWMKVKAVNEQEFIICGFTDPAGSREYFGALLLGVNEGSELVYAGHVGTGFTEDVLRSLYELMRPLEQAEPPFHQPPRTNTPAHWIRPELVAEVKFTEWTREGYLRHPSFLGLRQDVEPGAVVHEQARKAG